MTNTPAHLTESSFRVYEDVLGAAVTRWPLLTEVDPIKWSLSPITVTHGLRNAKQSLIKYNWVTHKVDVAKLLRIEQDFVVRHKANGMVVCGPRNATKTLATTIQPESSGSTVEPYSPKDQDLMSLMLFVDLANNQCLKRKLRIVSLTSDQVVALQSNYDIALVRQDDGSYLLS